MSDSAVLSLARAAGLEVQWTDAGGARRRVGIDTLQSVLQALGYPALSRSDIAESRARILEGRGIVPPLLVAKPKARVRVGGGFSAVRVRLEGEDVWQDVMIDVRTHTIRAPETAGYHTLQTGKTQHVLAVVPHRCFTFDDVRANTRLAGIAVQVPSLRGGTTEGFGDFAALAQLADDAGRLGFDAVMTSPMHALFGARPEYFCPYAPSTRFFPNPLLSAVPAASSKLAPPRGAFIDWAKAAEKKHGQLRGCFKRFDQTSAEFESFCKAGGTRLLEHAIFEVLDRHFRARRISGRWQWPAGFEGPGGSAIGLFVHEHKTKVRYELFLQWLAAQTLASAQKIARNRMAIGLILDIAVGVDPQGSHAWSAPEELFRHLHIGAPPDAFNARGQDWGLTTFSPAGLRNHGYAGFLDMLRAGMRCAGGVRIDHAIGLQRLWVLPEGAAPTEGVYLRYPRDELIGLIALESQRHRAVVIGEDLGTVPAGFRKVLADAGIAGMQVLWFERGAQGSYRPARKWRREAVAMTTTHDLPTIAGWWTGRDIDWQGRLGHLTKNAERRCRAQRKKDRSLLWSAFREDSCAKGKVPPRGSPERAIEAALAYVGATRACFAIAPLEDLAGETEQPNLPGTVSEHPNWRRRLRKKHPLRDRKARRRAQRFLRARTTN